MRPPVRRTAFLSPSPRFSRLSSILLRSAPSALHNFSLSLSLSLSLARSLKSRLVRPRCMSRRGDRLPLWVVMDFLDGGSSQCGRNARSSEEETGEENLVSIRYRSCKSGRILSIETRAVPRYRICGRDRAHRRNPVTTIGRFRGSFVRPITIA